MQLNTKSFALATATTMGIMYVLCVLVVAVAPDFALQLLGWVAHDGWRHCCGACGSCGIRICRKLDFGRTLQ